MITVILIKHILPLIWKLLLPVSVRFFWYTGRGYNELESYSLNVSSGKFQEYNFPLSGREIKSIRFDPVNVLSVIQLKNATVVNRRGDIIKRTPLSDFKPVQQIAEIDYRKGLLRLKTIEKANDPIIKIHNSSINTQTLWKEYLKERADIIIRFGVMSLFFFTGLFYLLRITYGNKLIGYKIGDQNMFIKEKMIRREDR